MAPAPSTPGDAPSIGEPARQRGPHRVSRMVPRKLYASMSRPTWLGLTLLLYMVLADLYRIPGSQGQGLGVVVCGEDKVEKPILIVQGAHGLAEERVADTQ